MFFKDRKSLIARFSLILALLSGMVGAARVEPVWAATLHLQNTNHGGAGSLRFGSAGLGNRESSLGEFYTTSQLITLNLNSVAANDGWILESSEISNLGGTLNATTSTFNIGDDKSKKQYVGILHFDTSSLPDDAVITSVTLQVQKQGITGTDPFTTHGDLVLDIQKPYFGTTAGLVVSDFQVVPGVSVVSTFDPTPVNDWYSATVGSAGYAYIDLTGTTQFRLRFRVDDDNDRIADTIKFYSGEAAAANRPQLVVQYDIPQSTHTISGNVGLGGASLSYLDGEQKTVVADEGGNYSLLVSDHWSGTITPSKSNYVFVPEARDYVDVQEDLSAQNYVAAAVYTISGNVGYADVTLSYLEDGVLKTAVSNSIADYSFTIKSGWSGTVTPSMTGIIFEPTSRSYSNVQSDQIAQDYIAAPQSSTRYVKWDASGANNGTSWADAYTNLQSALAAASSGDEIWVAAGTYKPTLGTDRSASFVLKNAVAVYGGFAGTETSLSQRDFQTNVTILSGDLGVAGEIADNSYRVVVGSNTNNSAVLDGFTITGAFGNLHPFNEGGGMYNYQGSPTVSNVIFTNNYSEFGGGMFNGGLSPTGSSPVLTNVTFSGNSALEGGGMENMHSSNPTLSNVVFSNNTALRSGGGMLNNNYNNPILTDVTFSDNTALWGGGMANWDRNNPTLHNVTFSGNSAEWGGGMGNHQSSPILTNVTFSGNSATTYGGAISNEMASSPTLTNVTISGNSAASYAGGIYNDYNGGTIRNSILYGNIGESIYSSAGSADVRYSIVQDGYPGTGNMDVAPLLGPLQDNGGVTQTMAILSGSPAIDAGNDATCASSDQRGVTRPQGSHCDIGAYEAQYYTISGNAGAPGVILSYADTIFGVACVALPDGSMSCTNPQPVPASKYHYVTSDQDGNYSLQMPQGWGGTVVPSKPGYTFSPVKRTYSDLSADQLDQDYVPSAVNSVLPPDPGSTRRIVPADAVPSDNPLNFEYLDISGNGRYVAYVSNSPDLVTGDTNERSDAFVWDRLTNTTRRISVNSAGEEANDHSFFPSLSKDGRYVAFESWATNLDPACIWGRNVFVHDTQTGITICVSVNASGEQGMSTSDRPMISADGRYVVYKSFAYNLVNGDTNNHWDVFVFDIFSRTTVRASVSSTGVQGNSYSEDAAISGDGRYVAFWSNASTLVDSDSNGRYDIFVRDLLNNTTKRVSVNSSGVEANAASFRPSISEDGRFVAFASHATNLVDGDTNASTDVFVHDTQTGTTSRVSLSSNDVQGNNISTFPTISSDGRFVVFQSGASNLVSNDTNVWTDIFLRDRLTNRTSRVSVASDGSQATNESLNASLSSDGRYVVFESMATNLVSPVAPNRYPDSFLHERDTVPPAVLSITRANANPTSGPQVDFNVTFSEPVTGVDAGDFVLTATGLSGASIASVSGSNSVYLVRVNTGTGSGTLRIDVVDNDSIFDGSSNPLGGTGTGNGNFTAGESYTVSTPTNGTLTLNSVAANDGWILESAETSNLGGSLNATLTTFDVGDDKSNKQYAGFLHFDTSGLPDNAVITSVTLRVQRQSITGTDPFTTHGSLVLDIQKPYFGTTAALLTSDFQAAPGVAAVSTFDTVPVNNWYSAAIATTGYAYIDAAGTSQFRLRFSLDDNNDLGMDSIKFYSGEATATSRPQLIIEYYIP